MLQNRKLVNTKNKVSVQSQFDPLVCVHYAVVFSYMFTYYFSFTSLPRSINMIANTHLRSKHILFALALLKEVASKPSFKDTITNFLSMALIAIVYECFTNKTIFIFIVCI